MKHVKTYSPRQFAIFRILLGGYLFVHFLQLIPYAGELFGSQGVVPDGALNPTGKLFPNILNLDAGPFFPVAVVSVLTLLSVLLALGIGRRWVAVLLWYGWACLFNRNNLISNPSLPYIGLLLVFLALVPEGEPWSFGKKRDAQWKMPAGVYWGSWILLAAGYTYSGFYKFLSPSWLDGSALAHVLENPLARPNFLRAWLLQLPESVLAWSTWLSLLGEAAFLILSISKFGRFLAWTGMLIMHVGILLVVDFADLTFGMLLIHFFVFDPEWLRPAGSARHLVLYDGRCGICNGTISFLSSENLFGAMQFEPLQGAAARTLLRKHGLENVDSLIFIENAGMKNERALIHSDAVIQSVTRLGGMWAFAILARAIPRAWRDRAYDWVRRNRYALGGGMACSIPR